MKKNKLFQGGRPTSTNHLRLTLSWETDANDLDLHAQLQNGDHVFYSRPRDRNSDLRLYQDLTAGLGPEVMTMSHRTTTMRVGARLFRAGAFSVVRGVVVAVAFTQQDRVFYPRIMPFSADADGQLQVLFEISASVGTQGYRESFKSLCREFTYCGEDDEFYYQPSK